MRLAAAPESVSIRSLGSTDEDRSSPAGKAAPQEALANLKNLVEPDIKG